MKGVIKEVGRYVVGEVVGEGSFGKVYKGVDRFDRTEVALKFISKRYVWGDAGARTGRS
jgi:serine/threonine protein kinase